MEKWTQLTRQTIAMAYACGGHCMVPWDVYMPRDAPRYFGTPEQYADLFGFIRSGSRYFDGYQQAESTGCGVPVTQQADADSVHLVGGRESSCQCSRATGQARRSRSSSNWSIGPMIRSRSPWCSVHPASSATNRLKIRLLEPTEFEKAAHEAADQHGRLSRACQRDRARRRPYRLGRYSRSRSVGHCGCRADASRAIPESGNRLSVLIRIPVPQRTESSASIVRRPRRRSTTRLTARSRTRIRHVISAPLTLAKSSEIRAIAVRRLDGERREPCEV